jgi:hypothetical protein
MNQLFPEKRPWLTLRLRRSFFFWVEHGNPYFSVSHRRIHRTLDLFQLASKLGPGYRLRYRKEKEGYALYNADRTGLIAGKDFSLTAGRWKPIAGARRTSRSTPTFSERSKLMTLLDAVLKHAADIGEKIEDLLTDADEEQLAMDMETTYLGDLYAHFWGRTYVLIPGYENGRNFVLDARRNPDELAAPLLTRLPEPVKREKLSKSAIGKNSRP